VRAEANQRVETLAQEEEEEPIHLFSMLNAKYQSSQK